MSFALFILRRARSTLSARSAHPTRTAGTPPRSVHLFVGSRRASAGPLQGQARTCRSLSVACRGRRSSVVNRSLRTGTCSGHHPPHSTCERHLNVCQPLPTPQNSARTSTLAQPTPPDTLVGVWTRGARPRGPGWHAGMGRRGICCANLAARSSVDPIFPESRDSPMEIGSRDSRKKIKFCSRDQRHFLNSLKSVEALPKAPKDTQACTPATRRTGRHAASDILTRPGVEKLFFFNGM